MRLSLHRTGDFRIAECAEDSTQCGFHRGDRQLWFDTLIESDSDHLDDQGFILDNNSVQAYFDERYAKVDKFVSCELIACQAIEDLIALMGANRVYYISVEIKPGTYAGIKAEKRIACHISGEGNLAA